MFDMLSNEPDSFAVINEIMVDEEEESSEEEEG